MINNFGDKTPQLWRDVSSQLDFLYFIVAVSITCQTIIMNIPLVIETAE